MLSKEVGTKSTNEVEYCDPIFGGRRISDIRNP